MKSMINRYRFEPLTIYDVTDEDRLEDFLCMPWEPEYQEEQK